MSQAKDNARFKSYKNKSLNTDEMRRRREEEGLQQKKDEQVNRTPLAVCFTWLGLSYRGRGQWNTHPTAIFQLFKRRNVATVEDDGVLEEDGMADSGYLESQANNMDPLMVRGCLHTVVAYFVYS